MYLSFITLLRIPELLFCERKYSQRKPEAIYIYIYISCVQRGHNK